MKKRLIIGLLAAFVIGLLSIPVLADYKDQVATDVRKEVAAFYQRNQDSKITVDVMDGLMLHLNAIFERNKIKEEVPKIDKPVSPVKKEVQK